MKKLTIDDLFENKCKQIIYFSKYKINGDTLSFKFHETDDYYNIHFYGSNEDEIKKLLREYSLNIPDLFCFVGTQHYFQFLKTKFIDEDRKLTLSYYLCGIKNTMECFDISDNSKFFMLNELECVVNDYLSKL